LKWAPPGSAPRDAADGLSDTYWGISSGEGITFGSWWIYLPATTQVAKVVVQWTYQISEFQVWYASNREVCVDDHANDYWCKSCGNYGGAASECVLLEHIRNNQDMETFTYFYEYVDYIEADEKFTRN
jgi:hypothetical protein